MGQLGQHLLPRSVAARLLLGNLAVAALYFSFGTASGLFFGAYGLFPAPIWLPAGIAAVACMIGGARMLPGIFAGSFLVNYLLLDSTAGTAGLISVGNSLGPWLGTMITRALRPPTGLFTRIRGVLGFMLGGVIVHAAGTASAGTLALVLAASDQVPPDAWGIFFRWWLCDAGGVFFFAPSLMLWLGAEQTPPARGHDRAERRLDMLILGLTVALAAAIFALPQPLAQAVRPEAVFLLTLAVSWATLRVSLRAAYALLTLLCLIATLGTLAGLGPFQGGAVSNPLRSVGFMIVLMATNALVLMALVSERREAEASLADSNERLAREVAARTEELRRLAETDDLTGVGNRGFVIRRLAEELAAARRSDRPVALILLDLDHFNALNRTRGHAAGDLALQAVVELCLAELAGLDVAFGRLRGEVFALVMPGGTAGQAAVLAERMRAAVARHAFATGEGAAPARLTASLGVTERIGEDGSPTELLGRADAAIYLAQARGGNRVEIRLTNGRPQEMGTRTMPY